MRSVLDGGGYIADSPLFIKDYDRTLETVCCWCGVLYVMPFLQRFDLLLLLLLLLLVVV